MSAAVYSTASLKESHAQEYKSMTGKLNASLLRALEVMDFKYMTPVQSKVLTELPSFTSDCLVQAKTGTGKTVAFLLPTLHSLLDGPPLPTGQVGILVLSPTRELALQIAKECDQLTSRLSRRLECHTAFGGTARALNLKKFMNGKPSVLVATPGRLKDYLSDAVTRQKFDNVKTVILDEADTMLEQGFLHDVKDILKQLPRKDRGWQGMCFSATIPAKIRDVINVVLKPGYTNISTIDKSEPPTLTHVPQYHVIIASVSETFISLASLLKHEVTPMSKIIVFGATANMVALYAKVYQDLLPLEVYQLQSRLSQTVRTKTVEKFKAAKAGVMFASDVIGRGMDFPNVDLVVQVGLPSSGEQYVHRVGRTARAGESGKAIIMLSKAESFFLTWNPQLPIKPHPAMASIAANDGSSADKIEQQMSAIDETTKAKAYSSYIGFFAGSSFLKKLRLDKAGLVAMANEFAIQGMKCPEPPPMERRTVGKMGLKGIPGFNFALPGVNLDGDDAPNHGHTGHSRHVGAPVQNGHDRAPSQKSRIRAPVQSDHGPTPLQKSQYRGPAQHKRPHAGENGDHAQKEKGPDQSTRKRPNRRQPT